VDDAIRAGVLAPDELPSGATDVLGTTHSERINTLVTDLVEQSEGKPDVRLSEPVFRALDDLRDFMFAEVYLREGAHEDHDKAVKLLRELFSYFLDHPDELPAEYRAAPGDLATRVADHVAGMTDRYALRTYERLFLPRGWLL
jgi:dGTPase